LAAPYFAATDKASRDQAQDSVDSAAAILSSAGCSLAVSTEILTGSPKRVIVEEAEKWGADLIVVGSHGYRTWERMLLGSVSHLVALHAECSVEIVRKRV
jgi:nucleotide-binding universal stress UspA family protein